MGAALALETHDWDAQTLTFGLHLPSQSLVARQHRDRGTLPPPCLTYQQCDQALASTGWQLDRQVPGRRVSGGVTREGSVLSRPQLREILGTETR